MAKKKRILIVAIAWSSHTQSWIELIEKNDFTIKIFNFDFGVGSTSEVSKTSKIYFLYKLYIFIKTKLLWLNLKLWRPQVVHSLGLFPASAAVDKLIKSIPHNTVWVVTARGGPELALWRLLPEYKNRISSIFNNCNFLIADNIQNYNYAKDLGLSKEKIANTGVVPGSGGMDIEYLKSLRQIQAVKSRIIVFPKAYECPGSKALPVIEAIKLCWNEIKPCKIYFTSVTNEIHLWYETLPDEIKSNCILLDRIARKDLFKLFSESRLVLMPSLTDGIPNTLYETMACGAIPLVSPIETLTEIFKKDVNVLYAKNLYPKEIAGEIIRGMLDDELAKQMILNNYDLVSKIADKSKIRLKVNNFYKELIVKMK